MKIKKLVELLLNRGLFIFQRTERCIHVLMSFSVFLIEMLQHRYRPIIRQRDLFDNLLHLEKQITVTEILLFARSHLLRAAIVDVVSVPLGSDGSLAGTTVHGTGKQELVFALALLLRFLRHHCLHSVEEVFGDDRLVTSLEEFAQAGDHPVVAGIPEHALHAGHCNRIAFVTAQTYFLHGQRNILQCVIACCIQLKGFADEWRFICINVNRMTLEIVDVPNRSKCRPLAPAQFLADTALHVLAQIIDIIFALAKGNAQHELSLWRILEPECREFQRMQCSCIEQMNDLPAVDGISRKTIGVPCEDAACISTFNDFQHFCEYGSAGVFGSSRFLEGSDDFKVLVCS